MSHYVYTCVYKQIANITRGSTYFSVVAYDLLYVILRSAAPVARTTVLYRERERVAHVRVRDSTRILRCCPRRWKSFVVTFKLFGNEFVIVLYFIICFAD